MIRPTGIRRLRLAALLLVALGCASSRSQITPAPAAPLVVTVVIDQFAGWIAAERWPLLPADGGFARLRREGLWAKDMRYGHANTETAPGHAALYTGQTPRANGIYTNDFPGEDGARIAIVRDADAHLLTAAGPTDRAGASLHRLRVPTLADRLRESHPEASIVTLSLKDRGALFGGGRRPDAALWFDHANDVWVTSTALAGSFPSWAASLTTPEALAARRSPWLPLPGELAALHATADDAPGEGDYQGLGTVFPHDFARATKVGTASRVAPQSDALLLDLALAAVDQRRPGQPMLLAVSLSVNDYVLHIFGPDSREAWDVIQRLDRELARFLDGLDRRVGAGGWSLLLAADHGTVSMPEVPASARPWCANAERDPWQRPCDGGRIDDGALLEAMRETAAQTLGPGDWVRGMEGSWLFLGEAAWKLPAELRTDLFEALSERLTSEPGVARVVDLTQVPETCGPVEEVSTLVCAGTVTDDGAALYTVPKQGWAFFTSLTPGRGTNHGSTFLYDRSVPLLVRAPGRVTAGLTIDEPLSFASFSRTAAALLGIPAPAGDAGRDLTAPN